MVPVDILQWFEKDPARFKTEREALVARYPDLSLEDCAKGYRLGPDSFLPFRAAVIEGICPIDHSGVHTTAAYDIAVVVPSSFPDRVPLLYCRDRKFVRDIDRHILSDGQACLCVRSEFRRFLGLDYRLVDFMDKLVHPFLVGQYHYELNGRWPWKDRSHGVQGIIEAYQELTGLNSLQAIIGFAEILARKSPAKGHWICPCGSGRRLRFCHLERYLRLRESIDYEDAASDLAGLREWRRHEQGR